MEWLVGFSLLFLMCWCIRLGSRITEHEEFLEAINTALTKRIDELEVKIDTNQDICTHHNRDRKVEHDELIKEFIESKRRHDASSKAVELLLKEREAKKIPPKRRRNG